MSVLENSKMFDILSKGTNIMPRENIHWNMIRLLLKD